LLSLQFSAKAHYEAFPNVWMIADQKLSFHTKKKTVYNLDGLFSFSMYQSVFIAINLDV